MGPEEDATFAEAGVVERKARSENPGKRLHWAWSLAILTGIAFFIYGPALNRVFVADQIYYMAEVGGDRSISAGLALYDYAAFRRYQKGDDISFRPLLFVWLSLCNTLFSHHHVWWNVATLALHVLVAFQLYRLLNDIQPALLALAVATLFVVLKPIVELPLWSHLGGYLLAWLFFTVAARAFVRMTTSRRSDFRTLLMYAIFLTAACLCHESMFLVSILAGAIVLVSDGLRERRVFSARVLAVAAPVVIFATLYGFHVQRVERLTYMYRPGKTDQGLGAGRVGPALRLMPIAAVRWSAEMAVPSALSIYGPAFNRFGKAMLSSSRWPANVFNFVLAVAAIGLVLSTSSREHRRRLWPVLVFWGGSILIYLAAISFSRAPGEVIGVTYYVYFYCLALVTLIYSMGEVRVLVGKHALAAWVVTLVVIASHASQTRALTVEIGQTNAVASGYFTELENFVDRHSREDGFSFAVEASSPDVDPQWRISEGYPDNPKALHTWSVSAIVFGKYYNAETPKYVLRWDGSRIHERLAVAGCPWQKCPKPAETLVKTF